MKQGFLTQVWLQSLYSFHPIEKQSGNGMENSGKNHQVQFLLHSSLTETLGQPYNLSDLFALPAVIFFFDSISQQVTHPLLIYR